ncbi:MAG: MBL fold metallo-hydrolase [Deltaproteobacteria bacterium]|jgi:phosphoribosyl 1,2-cyclic phosphodiesterase|nr:MBL fold metallo-hydrolase [Deltaproteobacteria bacterium]
MRFCLLASGSRGNALWIEENDRAVAIDNGLSAKDFTARAFSRGLKLDILRDIAVSHEHSDHVRGIGPLARRYRLNVWATDLTVQSGKVELSGVRVNSLKSGEELSLGTLKIQPVPVSHDAAEPVGFVIRGQTGSLGVVTDLGVVTHQIRDCFQNLNALILEFNHDLNRLLEGPYPYYLKQRVRSRTGHLSNEQGAELLAQLYHPDLNRVILGHLSETNNTPELALAAAGECLSRLGVSPFLMAAAQDKPTPVFDF